VSETPSPDEVQAAVDAWLATRERIEAGDATWSALADHFTDDAVFVDPAWGRVEGLDAMRETVFGDAMDGLEKWRFPIDFVMVDGDTVVVKWRQVIAGPKGTHEQSGVSTMVYGRDGKFRYEEDLLNMVHVFEGIKASGWRPPEGGTAHIPPSAIDRNFTIPGR
jgi:ketosteroid isomerase-like protein